MPPKPNQRPPAKTTAPSAKQTSSLQPTLHSSPPRQKTTISAQPRLSVSEAQPAATTAPAPPTESPSAPTSQPAPVKEKSQQAIALLEKLRQIKEAKAIGQPAPASQPQQPIPNTAQESSTPNLPPAAQTLPAAPKNTASVTTSTPLTTTPTLRKSTQSTTSQTDKTPGETISQQAGGKAPGIAQNVGTKPPSSTSPPKSVPNQKPTSTQIAENKKTAQTAGEVSGATVSGPGEPPSKTPALTKPTTSAQPSQSTAPSTGIKPVVKAGGPQAQAKAGNATTMAGPQGAKPTLSTKPGEKGSLNPSAPEFIPTSLLQPNTLSGTVPGKQQQQPQGKKKPVSVQSTSVSTSLQPALTTPTTAASSAMTNGPSHQTPQLSSAVKRPASQALEQGSKNGDNKTDKGGEGINDGGVKAQGQDGGAGGQIKKQKLNSEKIGQNSSGLATSEKKDELDPNVHVQLGSGGVVDAGLGKKDVKPPQEQSQQKSGQKPTQQQQQQQQKPAQQQQPTQQTPKPQQTPGPKAPPSTTPASIASTTGPKARGSIVGEGTKTTVPAATKTTTLNKTASTATTPAATATPTETTTTTTTATAAAAITPVSPPVSLPVQPAIDKYDFNNLSKNFLLVTPRYESIAAEMVTNIGEMARLKQEKALLRAKIFEELANIKAIWADIETIQKPHS